MEGHPFDESGIRLSVEAAEIFHRTSPSGPRARKGYRFHRFTLRSLLAGIGIIGLLLGFRANQAFQQRRVVENLRSLGAVVLYEHETEKVFTSTGTSFSIRQSASRPHSFGSFLPREFCYSVATVASSGSADPREVACLASQLADLHALTIRDCDLRNHDLAPLCRLKKLHCLTLTGTSINDEGLPMLIELAGLGTLDVRNTGITAEGGVELRRSLPDCKIDIGPMGIGGMF